MAVMFTSEPFGGLIPGAQAAVLRILLRTGAPLTGRQVHKLTDGAYSLATVQTALKVLQAIGVIEATPVGRALMYSTNNDHIAVPALRLLMDPRELLRSVVSELVADDREVVSVILFGSAGRKEAGRESDIDLAVLTTTGDEWERRWRFGEEVERRFGGSCDILVFGVDEFEELARAGTEPVVSDIIRDRFSLYGAPISRNVVRRVEVTVDG